MAKRKFKDRHDGEMKDIQDVVSKKEKIDDNDLADLQTLVNKINHLQYNVGKIEMQKHNFLHDLAEMQDEIKIHQEKLLKKYGSYDVSLVDGKINWPEDEDKKDGKDEK